MKRLVFGRNNRSGDLLHVEAPGAVINVWVNLTRRDGREVTRVEIIPDGESRGGDEQGRVWDVEHNEYGTCTLLVRRPAQEEGGKA